MVLSSLPNKQLNLIIFQLCITAKRWQRGFRPRTRTLFLPTVSRVPSPYLFYWTPTNAVVTTLWELAGAIFSNHLWFLFPRFLIPPSSLLHVSAFSSLATLLLLFAVSVRLCGRGRSACPSNRYPTEEYDLVVDVFTFASFRQPLCHVLLWAWVWGIARQG